jgi:hypothetical protein
MAVDYRELPGYVEPQVIIDGLITWGDFYKAVCDGIAESVSNDLSYAIKNALFSRQHDYLSKFLKQIAKERNLPRCHVTSGDESLIVSGLIEYYREEKANDYC